MRKIKSANKVPIKEKYGRATNRNGDIAYIPKHFKEPGEEFDEYIIRNDVEYLVSQVINPYRIKIMKTCFSCKNRIERTDTNVNYNFCELDGKQHAMYFCCECYCMQDRFENAGNKPEHEGETKSKHYLNWLGENIDNLAKDFSRSGSVGFMDFCHNKYHKLFHTSIHIKL